MYKIIILERAVLETKEAFEWYESKSVGLGKRFNAEVKKSIKLIRQQPDRYALKNKSYREVHIKTFPYLVVYQINEISKEISITSLFHTKRNPANKY